jgi:hypothetical protein
MQSDRLARVRQAQDAAWIAGSGNWQTPLQALRNPWRGRPDGPQHHSLTRTWRGGVFSTPRSDRLPSTVTSRPPPAAPAIQIKGRGP